VTIVIGGWEIEKLPADSINMLNVKEKSQRMEMEDKSHEILNCNQEAHTKVVVL
jgi:hypothetical protein